MTHLSQDWNKSYLYRTLFWIIIEYLEHIAALNSFSLLCSFRCRIKKKKLIVVWRPDCLWVFITASWIEFSSWKVFHLYSDKLSFSVLSIAPLKEDELISSHSSSSKIKSVLINLSSVKSSTTVRNSEIMVKLFWQDSINVFQHPVTLIFKHKKLTHKLVLPLEISFLSSFFYMSVRAVSKIIIIIIIINPINFNAN